MLLPLLTISRVIFTDSDSSITTLRLAPALLPAPGKILNVNTLLQFKSLDYNKFLNDVGAEIWKDITSEAVLKVSFVVLFAFQSDISG